MRIEQLRRPLEQSDRQSPGERTPRQATGIAPSSLSEDGGTKDPDNLRLYLDRIAGHPLLEKGQEQDLAEKIFKAKLAVRNIHNIIDLLPVDQQVGLEKLISTGVAEQFLKSLDNVISQKEEDNPTLEEDLGEENGGEKEKERNMTEARESLISDVANNDRMVEEKIKSKGEIQEFAKLQLDLFHQGSKAYDSLTNANLRLVVSIATKKYSNAGSPLLDIIQEGNIGLMTAVLKFNPRMGYKFSTYATGWIKQHIQRAIPRTGNIVSLPVHAAQTIRCVRNMQDELRSKLQREVSIWEAAEALGYNPKRVEKLFKLKETASLDRSNDGKDGEPDEELSLLGLVPDPGKSVEAKVWETIRREKIREVLLCLPPRERLLLELRFGFYDGKFWTLEEVGGNFGVSRERVRQIEARALRKLRAPSCAVRLRPFLG